ncbi:DNA repair protein RecN [Fulvivirga imtechensis AK7]|uniref:DNA repair protein RecN n=1 Tax=Fulvivirga imtechensis AK7 TaxID=1237149 RepID=L8JS76_9BACT|nr:DNA repair protein RecN [Fulvivirga imtechensis]ELR70334.1 DNA repair protein RecN [Fulvivirga imtechensis AK7]
MLKHLLIKNYALIQHLEIDPSANLNIITGETGAGKSIMLGAVGLLLGNRADTKVLFNEEDKCVIEGQFDVKSYNIKKIFDEEELDYADLSIFRREISPSGKSRAFINDTPVTLDVLRRLGERLMDVHSQHETLHLGKHTYQLAFVDAFAGTSALRESYRKDYQAFRSTMQHLDQLKRENAEIGKEADYNAFLLEELTKAALKADEQEELESSLEVMEHAEEIKTRLNDSLAALSNNEFAAIEGLQQGKVLLAQLSRYGKNYSSLSERLESVFIELQDIIRELEKEEDQVEFDPEQTQATQDRLSLIYQLQQKHHVPDIKSLLEIQQSLEGKADRFNNMDEAIQQAEDQVAQLRKVAEEKAKELSKKRDAVFGNLEKDLTSLLSQVGIPEASVKITNTKTDLTDKGIDQINILFSANKGVAPQEVSKVASGGEFSRLMFCVKYILADKVSLPTIIFDEIDTGVSGEVAMKLGGMMKRMAQNHQVITISHLPQIAAKGDKHYFVFKDSSSQKAQSRIKALTNSERIEEIAKMIGGENPSSVAFENAKELISSS